ncbi:hypothetical protein ADUPG1_005220, partial [Aduncisulcus paluster]
LGVDLVRASCGLVVPYDPQKLYVDAKDVVERCAVRAAPGILYSIAACPMLRKVKFDAELCHRIYLCTEKFCIKFVDYLFKATGKGRDMELFSAALLNFAFCDATRELTDDSSHVTSSPAPVVTLERLLKSM